MIAPFAVRFRIRYDSVIIGFGTSTAENDLIRSRIDE